MRDQGKEIKKRRSRRGDQEEGDQEEDKGLQ